MRRSYHCSCNIWLFLARRIRGFWKTSLPFQQSCKCPSRRFLLRLQNHFILLLLFFVCGPPQPPHSWYLRQHHFHQYQCQCDAPESQWRGQPLDHRKFHMLHLLHVGTLKCNLNKTFPSVFCVFWEGIAVRWLNQCLWKDTMLELRTGKTCWVWSLKFV